MNGKRFKLSEAEAGVNYPPLHSNCRCAVLGVIK
jgi:SPP1 gp7 family putative phage head morphogenesis protein